MVARLLQIRLSFVFPWMARIIGNRAECPALRGPYRLRPGNQDNGGGPSLREGGTTRDAIGFNRHFFTPKPVCELWNVLANMRTTVPEIEG